MPWSSSPFEWSWEELSWAAAVQEGMLPCSQERSGMVGGKGACAA